MSVTNIHIYQNTLSGRCYNAKGATFGEYEPSVSYKSTFRLWWHLVTSDEGSDTETANVETWAKANLAGCSARLTCDNDFIHRINGKLKTAITAETAFSQIILTVSGADHTNIPSNGMITITSASGKNFDFEYTSLTIEGTTVTCDLGGEVTISENLAENATAKISQEVLFQSDNNAELSAPENGLFVFDCVAYSNKLIKAQETANSRFIDVMGIECLPFIVIEDGIVQEMPSYICETFKVSVNMGEAGSNPQLTPAEKNNAALIVQNLVSQGMSVELYNSTTDTWEPYSDSVTYTTAYTKYRFWLTSAGESSIKSVVPLLNGIDGSTPQIGENKHWIINGVDTGIVAEGDDGATPQIGENGNWFIGEVDTGDRAIAYDAKVEFSVDGTTWSSSFTSGCKYIRFSTDSGTTWSASAKFIGDNAPTVRAQYASLIGDWHDVQQNADMYIRFSVDGGTTWTGAMQVVSFPLKFRYCDTANGTFHADYLSSDKYMQHSVDNGVTWSSSIRITGTDGQSFVPNATGTLAERTAYNSEEKGFAYLVTSGTDEGKIFFKLSEGTADWSTGIQFTPHGLTMQFSVNGSDWHDTSTDDDMYIRFSVDGGTTWTTAARYQGKSHYVYYAYASDNAGNDFTLTFSDDLHFRNEIHTFEYLTTGELTAVKFNTDGLGWYQFGGTDGKTYEWYEGDTTPDAATGNDGDWYMNKDTCDLYRKEGADWRYVLNFRGKTGAGVTPRGIWDSTITYATNDMVAYQGGAYIASASSTGKIPAESPDYWVLYIEKGEDGAPISENYVIVTTLTEDGYIAVPNNNVPVKVELNGAIYDIDDCPMVNDGTNFKLLADYFLARANLTSYSGEYKVWLAGGKEGEKGEPGQVGGSFVISVVTALPTDPDPYTLYLFTE